MKKLLIVMGLLTCGAVAGAVQLYKIIPKPEGTAVIAEKPGKVMGGLTATLLPTNLTQKQNYLLSTAYKMAKDEGFKNPEIFQSILLQETKAGGLKSYKVANPGPDAYYGLGQLKMAAAKDVLQRNPGLYQKYDFHTHTDDEVKANLILNERFNMEIAVKYLKLLQTQYGLSGDRLLNAYNRGAGSDTANNPYAAEAKLKLARFRINKPS